MSQYFDDTTRAGDPGAVTLSDAKLRRLHPDLYGLQKWMRRLRGRGGAPYDHRAYLCEHLALGDSRAAVVMDVDPLLVAAYTDELDCVAMLWLPPFLVDAYRLTVGTRLLTINSYTRPDASWTYQDDLILGPRLIKRWVGFHPVIGDFVTDDMDRIEARKREIEQSEWYRTHLLGEAYLRARPHVFRDGRPCFAHEAGRDWRENVDDAAEAD